MDREGDEQEAEQRGSRGHKTHVEVVPRDELFGHCVEEATEELAKLIAAVESTGKAGKLTLTIAVKPLSKASGALEVRAKAREDALKKKDPKKKVGDA